MVFEAKYLRVLTGCGAISRHLKAFERELPAVAGEFSNVRRIICESREEASALLAGSSGRASQTTLLGTCGPWHWGQQ